MSTTSERYSSENFEPLAISFDTRGLHHEAAVMRYAATRITTLESALAECRRDAERYRWLKTRHDVMSGDKTATVIFWNDHGPYEPPSGFSLDNAIDAAIARSETNDDA